MTTTELPPAAPAEHGRHAARRAPRSPVLSPRAGAVLGVIVVLVTMLAIPIKTYLNQRSRIAGLESDVAWHSQRVADLSAAHKRWQDPAFIEAQARARLHFVRIGQIGYVVLTDQQSEVEETTTTRPQGRLRQTGPWWSVVWGTVTDTSDPKRASNEPLAPAPASAAPSYGG
ncbi:MAG: FtsB family cell division protein [Candidatus Nanopelagicales bacterium]